MKAQKGTPPAAKAAPENPYLAARREWAERYGDYIAVAHTWRLTAVIALAIAAIAVLGALYIGAQSRFVPYVVEVNKLGDELAVRPANEASKPDDRVIRASLARWITEVRTVYIDSTALRQNINGVYSMLANGSPASQAMNDYFRAQSPFDRAQHEVVTVEVQPPMPISGTSWRVEWRETVRPLDGGNQPTVTTWAATITYEIVPPTNEATILVNPAGIYIRQFSWSQRQ